MQQVLFIEQYCLARWQQHMGISIVRASMPMNIMFPRALAQKVAALVPFPPVLALVHTAVAQANHCAFALTLL